MSRVGQKNCISVVGDFMIYLYSGTPGSGKSLHVAYDIINNMIVGRNVIANFPIDKGYFAKRKKRGRRLGLFYYFNNQVLTVEHLKQYAKKFHKLGKEHQTLVVIDECAAMFNCRAWDAKGRMEWIYFFQQHRKLGFDIILVSQHDRLIDRQIRAFIETEYKHRAIRNYKKFGRILSIVTGGLFVAVEYWYGTRLKCGSDFFTLNKRKASIYDTYLLFE